LRCGWGQMGARSRISRSTDVVLCYVQLKLLCFRGFDTIRICILFITCNYAFDTLGISVQISSSEHVPPSTWKMTYQVRHFCLLSYDAVYRTARINLARMPFQNSLMRQIPTMTGWKTNRSIHTTETLYRYLDSCPYTLCGGLIYCASVVWISTHCFGLASEA
jgi:hypothetical protein